MNKKKIFLSLIIVLGIIGVIYYGIVFLKYKNKKIADNNKNEILETTAISEVIEDEEISITNTEDNANIESEPTPEIKEEIKTEEKPKVEQPVKQIQSSNEKNTTSTNNKKENETIKNTPNNSQTQQGQQSQAPTKPVEVPIQKDEITEDKKQENTPDNSNKDTTQENTQTKEEKYIRNDAMINKIKQIIQNNESEYMKTYGYEIVVDSSIKGKTNQFTFTENRVKAYLTHKFGTIRVYVEDYYVNGQLVMTECYIF